MGKFRKDIFHLIPLLEKKKKKKERLVAVVVTEG